MAGMLTEADVRKLMTDPSPDARVETATKVSKAFYGEELTDKERELASEIFRIMVLDAEVRVREALSINLKASPALPKALHGKVKQRSRLVHKNDVLGVDPAADSDARVMEMRIQIEDAEVAGQFVHLQVDIEIDTSGH